MSRARWCGALLMSLVCPTTWRSAVNAERAPDRTTAARSCGRCPRRRGTARARASRAGVHPLQRPVRQLKMSHDDVDWSDRSIFMGWTISTSDPSRGRQARWPAARRSKFRWRAKNWSETGRAGSWPPTEPRSRLSLGSFWKDRDGGRRSPHLRSSRRRRPPHRICLPLRPRFRCLSNSY